MDGGPGRQTKVCQHRRGRRLAGAHRRQHTKQERCNKIQTLQFHVPRGHTAQGSCRVEQERGVRVIGVTLNTAQRPESYNMWINMAFPLYSCSPLYTERAPQTRNHLERGEGRRGRSGLGVSKADGRPQAQAREPTGYIS